MRRFAAKPYVFTGANGRPACCDVETIELDDGDHGAPGRCVVIASERPDNPGMSVTNAAGVIATSVCNHYQIHPSRLVYIEHYPRELPPVKSMAAVHEALTGIAHSQAPTWDLVTFTWHRGRGMGAYWPECGWHFEAPRWEPMERVYWLELGIEPPREVARG